MLSSDDKIVIKVYQQVKHIQYMRIKRWLKWEWPLDLIIAARSETLKSQCTKSGYRGGSPTAVQAWWPCPLWEPSP